MEKNRLFQLDVLRGFAAIVVVIGHILFLNALFPIDTSGDSSLWLVNLFKYTPLSLLFDGSSAVLLFFCISGYVLSVFLSTHKISYKEYLIKRFLRIYPAYWLVLCWIFFVASPFRDFFVLLPNTWLNKMWGSFTWGDFLNQVFLIGFPNTNQFDTVAWSLVHEVRISIIFPFVYLFIERNSKKKACFSH